MDLLNLFRKLYDYVVMKCNTNLPKFSINDDIDILTSDISKNINIIAHWYDNKTFIHRITRVCTQHIHFDLLDINSKKLILRFDLYEKLTFEKFSLHHTIYRKILKNKIFNGVCFVPCLCDDLSIRYCEYVEFIDERKDKIKHLNYVSRFTEDFYKISQYETNSKLNYNEITDSYNSVIIWGHGVQCAVDIIDSLNSEIDCEILNVYRNTFDNLSDMIRTCYGSEMLNSNHIIQKTRYLQTVQKEYVHILIHNYGAKCMSYGDIVADKYIVDWKWRVRNKFNPRRNGVHVKPLDSGVTHDHVIHVTDTDDDCINICRNLLNKLPSEFECKYTNIVYIPWHIKAQNVSFKEVNIDKIKISMAYTKKLCSITDTPHYQYVIGNKQPYILYYNKYMGKELQDNHTPKKFDSLLNTFEPLQYKYEVHRLILVNRNLTILDGAHRISILKASNIKTVNVAIIH